MFFCVPRIINKCRWQTLDSTSFEHLDKQLFAYEVEYQVMREEEIMNSPVAGGGASASARGAQSGSVPKSGTSVDLASAGLRSEKEHNSSVQKHNEFCLEKVAALNKKLERDKYALELKAQQLKQQTYDLQVSSCHSCNTCTQLLLLGQVSVANKVPFQHAFTMPP